MRYVGLEFPIRKVERCLTNPKPRRVWINHDLQVFKVGPWIRTAQPQRTASGIHRLDFFVLLYQDKSTRDNVNCINNV